MSQKPTIRLPDYSPSERQTKFHTSEAFETLYGGAAGGGKRLADTVPVMTDHGWVKAGDVSEEDRLVAPDGTYTSILRISRANDRPTYRMYFADGQSIDSDDEHNWLVRSQKHGKRDGWVVRNTRELLNNPANWTLPLLDEPVPGPKWEGADPYTLGYILGDGTLTGRYTTIYTTDYQTVEYLRANGWHIYDYSYQNTIFCQYTREDFRDILGRNSKHNKYIPRELLMADPNTRLAVLQGLMDSDGTCGKDGSASFCTFNENLRDGLIYLVRSLGGRANWRLKTCGLKSRNPGARYFHVKVSYGNKFIPFRLQRKIERCVPTQQLENLSISKIERIENTSGTCFEVDHPSHLYVIDNFIITHNTAALCAEAITAAIEQPGTRIYIFRRTLQDLRRSVFNEIMRQIAKYQNLPDYQKVILPNQKRLIITYNNQESAFKFSNDSFIQFAYLDNIADRYRYQSAEIHLLLVDELTHFLQDDYEYLKTRVRSAETRRLRVMAATNPGNVGHGWVRDYFIESKDPNIHRVPEEIWTDEATGLTRVFIPAKLDDHPNENFKRTYGRVLDAIPDEHLRAALRDGDWHTFEGQVYTEWDRDKHVIQEMPEGWEKWPKYIGFDWGYNDYACASWIAVEPENELGVKHLYVYREIYDRQRSPTWWAREIRKIIDEEPIEYMILPHDCYSHLGGNQTISRTFSDYDIPHVRADSQSHSAKMHRIALMHQLLQDSQDGDPTLKFTSTCANNIRTIPDLPYSDTKPEEISDKSEDHSFDSTTYGLMVIVDGNTWIVGGSESKRESKSFIINEKGEAEGLNYDIKRALEDSMHIERDWRYL